MKKEDVRSEEERGQTFTVDGFLGTVRLRLRLCPRPHVFISFSRHGTRHSILALDQTTCLVRFSVYIVYRSTRCRNFVRAVTSPFLGSPHVQPPGHNLPTLSTHTHANTYSSL